MSSLLIVYCGWCSHPVPQPEDGNQRLYCTKVHQKRASEKRRGKTTHIQSRDITCFGCGEKDKTSSALRDTMALCPDCHWMSYAMCWRKQRISNSSKYARKSLFTYSCPICHCWHWTKKEDSEEYSEKKFQTCQRIGDYVRRMGFTEDELRKLAPHGWEARVTA